MRGKIIGMMRRLSPVRTDALLARRHRGVFYLTLFVTNRCNLRCRHCFYAQQMDRVPGVDMPAATASAIFKHFGRRLASVIVTGGEPLLHPDLAGICRMIGEASPGCAIDLDSNGMMPEKLVDVVRTIRGVAKLAVNVQISVDGLEKTHDFTRGKTGCFRQALATLELVKSESLKDRHITCCALTTITRRNADEVVALNDFLAKGRGMRHNLNIVRGTSFGAWRLPADVVSDFNPADPDMLPPELDILKRICESVYGAGKQPTDKIAAVQRLKFAKLIGIIERKERLLECFAGYADGVAYPDGSVAICEFTKAVGSLGDFGMDFGRLWMSDAAQRMRRKTRRCACIHTCNLLHAFRFDPGIQRELGRSKQESPERSR